MPGPRSTSFRFAPPPVEWTPALAWVLGAAFAAGDGTAAPAEALRLARRLGLAERIATRRADAGEGFRSDRRHAAAVELRLISTLEALAAVPPPGGTRAVLLKFAALHASGRLLAGTRPAADLDVLADEPAGAAWIAALERAGFTSTEQPGYEHQWPALRAPSGALLELHRVLLGVRLDGRRSCGAADLVAHGLVGPAPGFASLLLPAPEVLLAHALVHGLAQHGLAPRAYPLARLLADAIDLGLGTGAGDRLLVPAKRWIERSVSHAEVDAVRDLCRALAAGNAADLPPASRARRLLDHVVAGALDPAYGEALKLRWLGAPLSDEPLPRALWRHWSSTLAPRAGSGRGARLWLLVRRLACAARSRARRRL